MKSQLIIVPVEQLLQKAVDVVGTVKGAVIYVSLSKTAEGMKKIFLARNSVPSSLGTEVPSLSGRKDLFFIDCVSHDGKDENVLYIDPTQLDKLDYAIRSFEDEIEGDKVIVLDALSTFLIYNNENKVAAFVKKIVSYAEKEGVSVLAFTPKTEEEELLTKIFNFFDEVEKE